MTIQECDADVFDPQRCGWPIAAVTSRAERLQQLWMRCRDGFKTKTRDPRACAGV